MEKFTVTIARGFGSGGRTPRQKLPATITYSVSRAAAAGAAEPSAKCSPISSA